MKFIVLKLGEEQWSWLEKLLENNNKDLVLIGSGIFFLRIIILKMLIIGSQILSEDRIFHDTWFTSSKYRLLELIKKHSIPGIFIFILCEMEKSFLSYFIHGGHTSGRNPTAS